MLTVSEEYKEAIKEQIRSFDIKAIILNKKQYIPKNNGIEYTNGADLGDLKTLFDNTPFNYNYACLQQDYFKLDGSFILPNSSNNKYPCFMGTDDTCSLSFYQNIYQSFYENGLTIVFDKGYAVDFNVLFYEKETSDSNWTLTGQKQITNNTQETIYIERVGQYNISKEKKITIEIITWSNNYFPVIKKILNDKDNLLLENDDIISIKLLEQADLRGLDIPANSISITLDNYNRQYNILEQSNILNKLGKNTSADIYLGLEINGAYEYIFVGGYHYISYKESSNKTIDFNFEGYTNYYFSNRELSGYNDELSVENACQNFFAGSNSNYINYRGNYPAQYLPITSAQEWSQEALIFYNASVKEKKQKTYSTQQLDGLQVFNITKLNANVEKYNISLNEQIRNPEFTKSIKTKTIRFNHYKFGSASSSKTEIYNGNIIFNETDNGYFCNYAIKTIVPIYKPVGIDIYYNDTKIVDNGSLVSGTGFGNSWSYTTNGYYEIKITLRPENESKTAGTFKVLTTTYEKITNITEINNSNVESGAVIEMNTNVIKDAYTMNRISKTIFNYENKYPYEFETEIMGDIRLEVGDMITLESLDGYHQAIIQQIDTTYNGGLTQMIKGVSTGVL